MPIIYGLVDPTNPAELRYVGKANNGAKRFSEHVQAAKRGVVRPCYEWIRSLLDSGVLPSLIALAEVQHKSWQAAEMSEIKKYRDLGHRLTNATDGGEGCHFIDDAAKEKHRLALMHAMAKPESKVRQRAPKSAAHREALSKALKGRPLSDAAKEKLSLSRTGARLSMAHRESISASHRARQKPSVIAQITPGKARGANHGSAKISESDAIAIKNSDSTCSVLAAQFGLSRAYISQIRRGLKWSHV